ncbi:yae1 domain-containing protein 1 [Vespula maculifrons]|uniref:Yae1 domain-containing protein 1 n=1 Tax=Vespula maculifrons TaxID=7453 RepID=A0ABD2C1R8_VESMC
MENRLNTLTDSSDKQTLKDEDLFIGYKNWNRLITAASTIGYKEGIEDGEESVFQEGFDMGYKDAFNIAFMLGKYKGLISSTQQNVELSSFVKNILHETKKGICYICNEESQSKDINEQTEDIPFIDLVEKQKTYSKNVIKTLHKNLELIMIKNNIDVEKLALNI